MVVDHPVDIAKPRCQKRPEQRLGHRQNDRRIDMQRPRPRPRHRETRRTIGKGRQGDDRIVQTFQNLGYGQKVDPGWQVLSVVFHDADRQDYRCVRSNPGLQLMWAQAGKLRHGRACMISRVWA